MANLDVVYADDEDLLSAAGSDFSLLLPAAADVAVGSDGAFDVADRWTLTSVSADFAGQGVASGQVCTLTLPASTRPEEWTTDGELFVIDATPTLAGSVTLRRLRLTSGKGAPPAPVAGLVGVTYSVRTLYSRIEEASFDLNRRLRIDPAIAGRAPTDLKDMRDLRAATVDMVLQSAYFDAIREPNDLFAAKYKIVSARLEERFSRLGARWTNDPKETRPSFGMRLSR
ncbi:MAG: hypothetical protein ABI353_16010 [Isosphaeraceae bacterium]